MIKYLLSKLILKAQIPAIIESSLDKTAHVAAKSSLVNVQMGKYSDIGYNCFVVNTNIGSFCSFGANIRIGGASHPVDWVSTSQVFLERKDSLKKRFARLPYEDERQTNIGNDVWIADNVLVKAGVTIGDGAVIGMGSVVTKDVPPYAIVAGNPAHIIRYRFAQDIIDGLLSTRWWDLDDEELLCYGELFDKPEALIKELEAR